MTRLPLMEELGRALAARKGCALLVDEQFRKCVGFLFQIPDAGGEPRLLGTGFFVSVPLAGEYLTVYLITARHVVDASRGGGELAVMLNTRDGDAAQFELPQDYWISHPTTDVAAMPLAVPPECDAKWIPFDMLLTPEEIQTRGVGPGEEVFFVGLFSKYPGYRAIQPIARFGNIALMPDEPMPVRLHPGSEAETKVEVYLVEARSWGGQSGSPAFIYYSPGRMPGSIHVGGGRPYALLGLVQGHYEIEQEVAFTGDVLGQGKVPVNVGIGIVIPAAKIAELLMDEVLVAQRDELIAALPAESGDLPSVDKQ